MDGVLMMLCLYFLRKMALNYKMRCQFILVTHIFRKRKIKYRGRIVCEKC